MTTTTMNFDPTLHAFTSGAAAGVAQQTDAGVTPTDTKVGATTVTGTSLATGTSTATGTPSGGGALTAFEGFLKTAGHVAGVVLSEIVKFVVPMAQVAAVADPAAAPALAAFTTSLQLVQTAVVSAQQRWAAQGATANTQKLADVLVTVEKPVILLFAQVGVSVDTAYVTNLINGVVAILNAQPGQVLTDVTGK